jgi:hypothetical protein
MPRPFACLYTPDCISSKSLEIPFLEREDILAAMDYVAHQTDHVILPTL